MKNSNNEPMKLTKSRIREPEAVAVARQAGEDVKNRAEKRVEVGKGGCEIGKWCSFSHLATAFSHLFPHNSTQVVDFPHLAMASQAELGTNMGKTEKNHGNKRAGSNVRRLN